MRKLALVCLLFAATTLAAETGPATSVVLLPFDDLSGADAARGEVAALLTKAIEAKGWHVASGADIDKVLERERVRYLDSLGDEVRTKILTESGATAVVSGTVDTFSEGRATVVAVSARMVRIDGSLAWSDVVGMSVDDTEAPLGFGRKTSVHELAQEVIETLMRHFPAAGAESAPVRGQAKPRFKSGPASFRAADLDPARPHRVCVLPFDNDSTTPEAARVVADVLAVRMAAANGFEVVEPAQLRAAALQAHIASFRNVASEDLARLAPLVHTSLFLRGTIFRFVDVGGRSGAKTPELQLEMTLVDVSTPELLWTAQHDRKGSDYIGFLMRGAVSNSVTLADRVVWEMIQAEAHGASGSPKAAAARKKMGGAREARNNASGRESSRGSDARSPE